MFSPVKLTLQTQVTNILILNCAANNTIIRVTVFVWSDPRNFVTIVLLAQLIIPVISYL